MSDDEHFLTRWSRRKREAAETADTAKPSVEEAKRAPERPQDGAAVERADALSAEPHRIGATAPEPAFDLTKLPSLDQITAETDIRAFLVPGVPPELARAALRRVWTADPQIRDFVGLAENAWDFTAPNGAPGFGPLEMTDELRQAVLDMVGRSLRAADPETPPPTERVARREAVIESSQESAAQEFAAPTGSKEHLATVQDETVISQEEARIRDEKTRSEKEYIATQQSPRKAENQPAIISRLHGGALPK